jgi:hypothetical protein
MFYLLFSIPWLSTYAEFHSPESLSTLSFPSLSVSSRDVSCSPESLRSPSFSHDSWHAEFYFPECLSMLSFPFLTVRSRDVSYSLESLMSQSFSLAKFLSWLLACWVSLSRCLSTQSFSPSWISWVNSVTPSHRQITWSFLNHLNIWDRQVSLMTLGMLSFTLLNVRVRWVLLLWISEFAKFLSWLLACWFLLSWISE